jgi:hypothetical protein
MYLFQGEAFHAAGDGLHLCHGIAVADNEVVADRTGHFAQVQMHDVLGLDLLHAFHHDVHQGCYGSWTSGFPHAG